MTRRRGFLLLAMVAVAVVLAVGSWLLRPRSAITPENAAKIQRGMTLTEVEKLLGGPRRNESTGPLAGDYSLLTRLHGVGAATLDFDGNWTFDVTQNNQWVNNSLAILVLLDAEGRVEWHESYPVHRVQEPILDMIRRWLGL